MHATAVATEYVLEVHRIPLSSVHSYVYTTGIGHTTFKWSER